MTEEPKKPEAEGKPPAVKEQRPLAKAGFMFVPQTWEQLYSYAKEIANTEFVPKSMFGKPGAVLACWQKGQEVGLPPMASLENIAIINGRPSIHSNGYWSLITSHPLCEWFNETAPDMALKQGFGECTIQRKGSPHPITRRFSMEEAKTAGLLGKDNWKNYPGDMLQNRARHRAGDDAIPEAAQGLLPSDVAQDLEPRDVTPQQEPLAIPQAIKEDRNEDGPTDAVPTDGPSGTESGGSDNQGLQGKPETVRPEKKEEPSQEEKIRTWLKGAPEAEILATKNYLTANLKGLSSDSQIKVIREWADAKAAIIKRTDEVAT